MSKVHKGFIPSNLEALIENAKSASHRALIGNINRGEIAWNRGKTGGTNSSKGSKNLLLTGSNHYKWIHDRTLLKTSRLQAYDGRYREWMWQVENRDGWKCQISNDTCSGHVEAHHILSWKNYSELRYEVNNGITLCHFHHPRKRADEEKYAPIFSKMIATKMN